MTIILLVEKTPLVKIGAKRTIATKQLKESTVCDRILVDTIKKNNGRNTAIERCV